MTWTGLLGFIFSATTEAVGSALAVFFGDLAFGNWWAVRRLTRVGRPVCVYVWIE